MKSSLFSLVLLMSLLLFLGALQPESTEPKLRADGFASARFPGPGPGGKAETFNRKRVMEYLHKICDLGPRISGTEGMKKQQELLAKHFKAHGAKVTWQKEKIKQVSQRQPVEMVNLIASWHPERKRRVMICAHYDTRPLADQEPNPRNWRKPFIAANDGASGPALMMELAHQMKNLKTGVGVDFVLFDGEEYIFDRKRDNYFLGSEMFAARYKKRKQKDRGYLAAILVDMIAGKGATFPIEQNSWWKAGRLVQSVYQVAAQLRCRRFQSHRMSRVAVKDDHLALNRVGIPAIDLIDFEYPHWHRLSDVPENCSADGMEEVGRVLVVWLSRLR